MSKVAQALSIAGSDSGGGAGIQADLKTFQERGVFGTTVITAITAQNTTGVFDIHQIPLQTIQSQLKAIADDFTIKAFKVGMLGSAEVIKCVAISIKDYDFGYLSLITFCLKSEKLICIFLIVSLKVYSVSFSAILYVLLSDCRSQ